MMRSAPSPYSVILARAGIQSHEGRRPVALDPRPCGDDKGRWDAEGIVA